MAAVATNPFQQALPNISRSNSDATSSVDNSIDSVRDTKHALQLSLASGLFSDKLAEYQAHATEEAPEVEHGVLAVDLDEAVHGLYASGQHIQSSALQGASAFNNHLREEAELLRQDPMQSLRETTTTGGLADSIVSLAANLIMLPLAWLAIKAGWQEWKHAKSQLKALNTSAERYQRMLNRCQYLPAADGIRQALQRARQRICTGLHHAASDRAIGAASFLSGSVIALKAGIDLAYKIILAVHSGIANGSIWNTSQLVSSVATQGSVAAALGLASTVVLAPLAGLAATVMGYVFLRKSTRIRDQLKKDLPAFTQQMQTTLAMLPEDSQAAGAQCLRASLEKYHAFINQQGNKRLHFFTKFAKWNKAFLIGSGLYFASASVKACVTVLAIAGVVGSFSNPVTGGIVLGVGLAGALVMAIASISFFTGHDRQARYADLASQHSARIDRDFLTGIKDHEASLRIQASIFTWLEHRKTSLRKMWVDAASAHQQLSPKDASLTIIKRWQGKSLPAKNLASWLKNEPDGQGALAHFALSDAKYRLAYLELKLAEHSKTLEALHRVPREKLSKKPDSMNDALMFALDIQERLESDIGNTDKLIKKLEPFALGNNDLSPELFNECLDYFGHEKNMSCDEKKAHGELGEFFLEQLYAVTKQDRGILFETALECAR